MCFVIVTCGKYKEKSKYYLKVIMTENYRPVTNYRIKSTKFLLQTK